jgi:hypothetical protein
MALSEVSRHVHFKGLSFQWPRFGVQLDKSRLQIVLGGKFEMRVEAGMTTVSGRGRRSLSGRSLEGYCRAVLALESEQLLVQPLYSERVLEYRFAARIKPVESSTGYTTSFNNWLVPHAANSFTLIGRKHLHSGRAAHVFDWFAGRP